MYKIVCPLALYVFLAILCNVCVAFGQAPKVRWSALRWVARIFLRQLYVHTCENARSCPRSRWPCVVLILGAPPAKLKKHREKRDDFCDHFSATKVGQKGRHSTVHAFLWCCVLVPGNRAVFCDRFLGQRRGLHLGRGREAWWGHPRRRSVVGPQMSRVCLAY